MKNNKNTDFVAHEHAQEYQIIRKDLYKVLALNAVYLVVILALYFTNQNSHYLERFFSQVLHF